MKRPDKTDKMPAAIEPSNVWVGLELEESAAISKIRFLPRTDGNSIYEGHTYDLFYWDGRQWCSLGKQTASNHQLHYRAPSSALLFMRNTTLEKNGRCFFMQNEIQKWL